jgi:hypothetical protein
MKLILLALLFVACSPIRHYDVFGSSSLYKGRDQQFEGLFVDKSHKEIPVYNIHEDEWLKQWNHGIYFMNGDKIKCDIYLHKVLAVKKPGKSWIKIYYEHP